MTLMSKVNSATVKFYKKRNQISLIKKCLYGSRYLFNYIFTEYFV